MFTLKKSLLPLLVILFGFAAHANDITTTKGEIFKNVKVAAVERDGLLLTSDYGIFRVRFDVLTPDIQRRYGYVAPPQAPALPATAVAAQAQTTTSPAPAAPKAPAVYQNSPAPQTYNVARVAENGSYYGQPNQYGVPKTVAVKGYYRKDGTYVRGHYRSAPRH
jgi:hypothetical protein